MASRSTLLRVHDMLESIRGIEKAIAGIGNILRHEYQRVDGQIIWNAVKDDLPALKKALLAIRASLKE